MNQNVLSAKQAVVSEISEKIKNADSAVVVEYRGLSVAEVTELRRALRKEEVEMKIYKNTLAQRAFTDCGFAEISETLTGPNAITFSKDATAPARVLAKFAKKHECLVLKSGIVEGKVVGIDVIKELSVLPNHDGMLSMLLSCLQSPVTSFARAIQAVADAKQAAGDAAPAVENAPAEQAA